MNPNEWRPKTRDIPTLPGVYKWRDAEGRVIYVGKAKNLRNRLTTYFQVEKLHPRTRRMVETARSLEWTVVSNEIEALTLEYSWIHQFDPRFNIIFRSDDKAYPYLAITNEAVPRVMIVRGKKNRKWKYFGPYPKSWAIRSTYHTLQQIYGFRSCSVGVFNSAKRTKRPCLLGYIGKCRAPCVGKIAPAEYQTQLDELARFLKGDIRSVLKQLEGKMRDASENLEFEKAASLRDQIEAIKVVAEKNSAELNRDDNLDVIGISQTAGDDLEAGVHIFHIRKGAIIGERVWTLELDFDAESSVIDEVLARMFVQEKLDIPAEIVVAEEPSQSMKKLLEGLRGTNIDIRKAERGDKRRLLERANENATADLENAKLQRTTSLASRTEALQQIQEALGMVEPPMRMECYDVSHTMGEFQTASMVVFEEGLPKKKDYRLFNIKDEGEGRPTDDTAAVYQVITRRLKRFNEETESAAKAVTAETESVTERPAFAYNPQLLVIDGGQPQVNAAQRAIIDQGMQDRVTVCSLAKRLEEIWLPNSDWPIIMPRDSLGLLMLQHLRDESHRFSIISMRKRRSKDFLAK